ncbi:RICIN domain-containing protein [Streptomyces sp. NPDC093260]|uniref:RICIN domain-containing protein n=1 Tax=Streptomyces sp. NPDC093260 TaxID=3155073 RepID=UPI0034404A91
MAMLAGTGFAAPSGGHHRGTTTVVHGTEKKLPPGLSFEHVKGQSDMVFYIKAKHSGKCMTVYRASTARGAKVNQYKCVGTKNQWWTLYNVADLTWRITGYQSGLCLSVAGGSHKNGAPLIQWTCNGAEDQLFMWPWSGKVIRSFESQKCLDVQGASKADNAPIIQWSCNFRNNQLWQRTG